MSGIEPPSAPGGDEPKKDDPPREPGGLLGVAFTSGFTLLAGLFVGYYGGRWLDGKLGTTPWLALVGMLLGIVAGFRVLLRDVLRESSRQEKPKAGDKSSSRKPDRE